MYLIEDVLEQSDMSKDDVYWLTSALLDASAEMQEDYCAPEFADRRDRVAKALCLLADAVDYNAEALFRV